MSETKLKAKELVDRYLPIVSNEYYEMIGEEKHLISKGEITKLFNAKQCALICQNNLLEKLRDMQDKEHSDEFWYIEKMILEEEDVKTEIEKL